MVRLASPSGTMRMALLLALVGITAFGRAEEPAAPDRWTFTLTPYLWGPSVEATSRFDVPGGGDVVMSLTPGDYLDNLDFAIMAAFEVRKGKWSILTDGMYIDFSNSLTKGISPVLGGPGATLDAKSDLKGGIVELIGGYELTGHGKLRLDVVAGVRYVTMTTQIDVLVTGPMGGELETTLFSGSVHLWDGVGGLRGRFTFGKRWFVTVYGDVGGGSSTLTWQALGTVGYGLGWGDILLGYRHLSYSLTGKVLDDMSYSGAFLGLSIHL